MAKINTVYVPYEIQPDKSARKCDWLPRFGTTIAVRRFLDMHGQRLRNHLLEWREHHEREFIEEYKKGLGTPYPPVIYRG